MSRCRKLTLCVAVVVLATGLLPRLKGWAQEAAAWRVECTGDGKTLDCRAVQQVFQRETRQLVVAVLVRKATDPKTALMTVQLPLGLNLTEPVSIKIDNGQVE